MGELTFHPVANLFPMMGDEEFTKLKADIADNGLRESIWIHDNQIIDGRNRYRACNELRITPTFREWSDGGSLVAFVCSLNLHRRHLSSSQRAVIALDILPLLEQEAADRMRAGKRTDPPQTFAEGQPSGEAAEIAAEIAQTNRQYIRDLKRIAAEDETGTLVDAVRRGELSVAQALTQLRDQKWQHARPVKQPTAVGAAHPDLAHRGADVDLLLVDEHSAIDDRTADITRLINEAVNTCTPKQQYIYRRHTGIQADGTQGERWKIPDIARTLDMKKESARAMYLAVHVKVLESLVRYWMQRALEPTTSERIAA